MSLENVAQTLKASIVDLQEEREKVNTKIDALRSVLASLDAAPAPKKRGPGRPKGSKNKTTEPVAVAPKTRKKRKRAKWTPEQKAAAAERMRKYWANRNQGNA